MTYPITVEIEHLEEGPYLGTSPDLPGLIVQADTLDEVIQMAPQLVHELIDSLMCEGDPLPKTLDASYFNKDNSDAICD